MAIKNVPFSGGCILDVEKAILPSGTFSRVQNLVPNRLKAGDQWIISLEKRKGQSKQHTTTAHSTKEIISGYQFSKGGQTERHLFAQYDDGHIDEATTNPPGTTTGDFGTSKLAARTGAWPASWSNNRDMCIMSDAAGQHQINTGQGLKPLAFIVYKGTKPIPLIPEEGADFTYEVVDGLSTTYADISSLDRLLDYHCLFIISQVPINKITLTMRTANGTNVGASKLKYLNDTGFVEPSGYTDGTVLSSATMGQTGNLTWTKPTDEVPGYAFGRSGFIYQWYHEHATLTLDSDTTISAVTVEQTDGFQSIQNVWDGVVPAAVEVQTYIAATTIYNLYASNQIKPSGLTTNDYLYFCSLDPLFGIYLDVGKTPNKATATISEVASWNGASFVARTGLTDGTLNNGITGGKSGYVTWQRNNLAKQSSFNSSPAYGYWYRIKFSATLTVDTAMTWGIETLPHFNINDIYPVGQASTSWDRRQWYSFQDNWLYGSAKNAPMTINGTDKVLLQIGERGNKILAMIPYFNNMFVFTDEKGAEGGYIVVVEKGATAAGYATTDLSSQIGIMNAKCAVVQEAANIADLFPERPIFKTIHWLSREGLFKTDGQTFKNVSSGVSNYFRPYIMSAGALIVNPECIRAGYESKHFVFLDKSTGLIHVGLVTGASATKPNVELTYDPLTGNWHTITRAQLISSMLEVEAASGQITVLQYGGGQDGYVRQLNTGLNDESTAIDADVIMELNGGGNKLHVTEETLICKSQAAGDITRDVYINGKAASASTRTFTMVNANAAYKGARKQFDVVGDHLSFRWRNNTVSQSMHLLEYGLEIKEVENNTCYE